LETIKKSTGKLISQKQAINIASKL
jgi:hypothetical protein